MLRNHTFQGPGDVVRTPESRPNTVGLNMSALCALMDDLDAADSRGGGRRRKFVRWPFRRQALEVRVTHPGGNQVNIKVACRNISGAGLSLLHNTYLHPGSVCEVTLPNPRRGPQRVRGVIVRCQHRSGVIHEIGIRFDQPLSVRDFVRRDHFTDWFSHEHVQPDWLQATVLVLIASPLDQKILKHFLRDTAVSLRFAEGLRPAVEAAAGVTMVISDAEVGGRPAKEVTAALRGAAGSAPILLIAPDSTVATQERMSGAEPDAVIAKPYQQDLLLRAMAEFLLAGTRATDSPEMAAALQAAWGMIRGYTDELKRAAKQRNVDGLFGPCYQIRAVAEQVRLRQLEGLAHNALQALASPNSGQALVAAIQALIQACEAPAAAVEPAASGPSPMTPR